jgi:hypothetical protein
MVQQLCPDCQANNPLENDYCGRCGANLQQALVPYRDSPLSIGDSRFLAPSLGQVGRAVAVSLVALAAEVGLSWLRRRVTRIDEVSPSRKRPTTAIVPRESPLRRASTRTIFSQRFVQIWEDGRLKGQGVEQSIWQVEE